MTTLLLLLPQAAAGQRGAPPMPPPYTGSVSKTSAHVASGCATVHTVVRPYFSLRTGLGGFKERSHASSCPASAYNQGQATGDVQVSFPFTPGKGTHTITIAGTLAATGSQALVAGPCPWVPHGTFSCTQESVANVYANAYIGGGNNSTALWGTFNQSYALVDCVSGSCTNLTGTNGPGFMLSSSFSWSFKVVSPSAATQYVLKFTFYGGATTTCAATGTTLTGCHASAAVDFATLGTGVDVTSIVVV